MATIIEGNKVKLDNGQVITPQVGGWYDGQQYWNGSLSQPGQIHQESNQPGAGGVVSQQVIAQTNPTNVAYVEQQRKKAGLTSAPATGVPASQPTAQSTPTGTAGTGSVGFTPAPAIDLPGLYQSMYEKSGITDIEKQLASRSTAYAEAVSKIKDNPYLSEATMTGRLKKLEDKFTMDSTNIRNQIATKKADIETQLNLQTKQFDINSQQAQLAFSQFNTLLQAGALDNASGEDIANITRATGISSNMIYSAIEANKKKNVETSMVSFDDGTNQGFAIVNSKTGEIISEQVVAESKPSGGGTVSERKEADLKVTQQNLIADIQSGVTIRDVVGHYTGAGGLSIEEVYRLYNTYTPYLNKEGKRGASETLEEVQEGKFGV